MINKIKEYFFLILFIQIFLKSEFLFSLLYKFFLMDQEAILPLIRSFDGVTEENCPDFNSLREGHVLAMIINQLSNDIKINLDQLLAIDRGKNDDWFYCLKNLKNIYNQVKEPFASVKLTAPVDAMGIARNSKPEQLLNFLSMIFVYALKTPKKDELMKIVKSLPKTTQAAFKELITLQINKPATPSNHQTNESASPKSVTTTPTKAPPTPSSVETPEMRTQRIKLEIALKRLESEKDQLLSENSDLKNEKEKIQNSNVPSNTPSDSSSESSAKIAEAMNAKNREEEEIKNLDNEIAELEPFSEQKNKLQAEQEAINARLKSLRQKISQSTPTIEGFRDSTDPTAIKLLQEIDEAEKIIRPDYTEKLRLAISKLKKEINNVNEDINEKIELLGGPQAIEQQPSGEGENKNENGNSDMSSTLSNDIDALTERNNHLNDEIVELLVRAEAIEKMKNQHSFLEHVRSSSVYLKPE